MEATIIDRIRLIKNDLGYSSDGPFADFLMINRSNYSQMMQGNRQIGEHIINKICVQTGANRTWLEHGKGEKYSHAVASEAMPIYSTNYMNVPVVTIPARAGYLRGYGDNMYISQFPTFPVIVDKNYRGKYMCFEIDGDSMDNGTSESILEGDIILGREIKRELWTSQLHKDKWDFIFVHRSEGIIVKRIISHDVESGIVTLHSLNELYEDFEISLNDVAEIYNVVSLVSRSRRR